MLSLVLPQIASVKLRAFCDLLKSNLCVAGNQEYEVLFLRDLYIPVFVISAINLRIVSDEFFGVLPGDSKSFIGFHIIYKISCFQFGKVFPADDFMGIFNVEYTFKIVIYRIKRMIGY